MLTMATVFSAGRQGPSSPRSEAPAPGIPGRVPAVPKSPAELTGSRSVSGLAGRSIPPAAQSPRRRPRLLAAGLHLDPDNLSPRYSSGTPGAPGQRRRGEAVHHRLVRGTRLRHDGGLARARTPAPRGEAERCTARGLSQETGAVVDAYEGAVSV